MAVKGILGEKLGMTQVFTDDGRALPVTVVRAGPCRVVQVRTVERDGYSAVQLGFGARGRATKPMAGHFAAADVEPTRYLVEVRTDGDPQFQPGQEIKVDVFEPGDRTDVVGVSRGKGFAGVMKRHGFHGVSASHGSHRNHRKPGSIGGASTPGRVFKGLRMAGQMGVETVTTQNVTVHAVDAEKGLVLLKGAVPGPKGGLVIIRSAAKGGPQ